jgi:hypothetical protein
MDVGDVANSMEPTAADRLEERTQSTDQLNSLSAQQGEELIRNPTRNEGLKIGGMPALNQLPKRPNSPEPLDRCSVKVQPMELQAELETRLQAEDVLDAFTLNHKFLWRRGEACSASHKAGLFDHHMELLLTP